MQVPLGISRTVPSLLRMSRRSAHPAPALKITRQTTLLATDYVQPTAALQPGDVLLTYCDNQTASLSYRVTRLAQRVYDRPIPNAGTRGNPSLVHAAICVDSAQTAPDGRAQVAEARLAKPSGTLIDGIRPGRYKVYRLRSERAGNIIAAIARRWAQDRSIRYSVFRAAKSIFGSIAVTPETRALAGKYAGEPDIQQPSWSRRGAFCSQFALAAVHKGLYLAGECSGHERLAVDARHVTPRVLDHLLQQEPSLFRELGEFIA